MALVVSKFTKIDNVHTTVMVNARSDGRKGSGSPFWLPGQEQRDGSIWLVAMPVTGGLNTAVKRTGGSLVVRRTAD